MPTFQCAVASGQRDEPIFATASQVRRWLLVQTPGAWGRDAVVDTDLGQHVSDEWRRRMRSAGVRVVAIRRDLERGPIDATRLFVVDTGVAGWPGGVIWRRDVAGLRAVAEATDVLPNGEISTPGWARDEGPLILVCTNGRHDSCCATFGRPLVRHLRTSEHAEAVWECSHIGGDRFAGNIVVLPDGLYFGRCGPEGGVDVADAYRRGLIDLAHYRGRSTLTFMHQAAEYFVRRQFSLDRIDAVLAVRTLDDRAGTFAVDLADAGTVEVTLRRTVRMATSALTCTGPTGLTHPAYELLELRMGRPDVSPRAGPSSATPHG